MRAKCLCTQTNALQSTTDKTTRNNQKWCSSFFLVDHNVLFYFLLIHQRYWNLCNQFWRSIFDRNLMPIIVCVCQQYFIFFLEICLLIKLIIIHIICYRVHLYQLRCDMHVWCGNTYPLNLYGNCVYSRKCNRFCNEMHIRFRTHTHHEL